MSNFLTPAVSVNDWSSCIRARSNGSSSGAVFASVASTACSFGVSLAMVETSVLVIYLPAVSGREPDGGLILRRSVGGLLPIEETKIGQKHLCRRRPVSRTQPDRELVRTIAITRASGFDAQT